LAPTTFHFSGKASPSNVNSSTGIISDIYYLMAHPDGEFVFKNILSHLEVVGTVWNTQIFLQRLNDAVEIVRQLSTIPSKSSMRNPFGQFAIKKEAAGKIRVFALVDSVTQSVMKPIHLGLFKVLRLLPNDGTFDQDASVTRCSEKARSGLLGFPDSPGGLNAVPNLRGAKSYADLRSYTPSPAPSTASHPIGRPGGISLEGLGYSGSSTNPNGTPTNGSMSQRDDGLLEREMSRMQLSSGYPQNSSPRSLRQMTSWDAPGPIGGHRTFSTNYDDRPSRQPRGPLPERGQGFSRPRQNGHQNRGSDELSSQSNVEILVGQ
jgi:hypothetical protein